MLLALPGWVIMEMGFTKCTTDGGAVVVDTKVSIAAVVAAVVATEVVRADIVVVGGDTAGIGVAERAGIEVAVEADSGAIVAGPMTLDRRIGSRSQAEVE